MEASNPPLLTDWLQRHVTRDNLGAVGELLARLVEGSEGDASVSTRHTTVDNVSHLARERWQAPLPSPHQCSAWLSQPHHG